MRMFILREFWIYPNGDGMFLSTFQVFLQSMQAVHLRTAPVKDLNKFLVNLDQFFNECEVMMAEIKKVAVSTSRKLEQQHSSSASCTFTPLPAVTPESGLLRVKVDMGTGMTKKDCSVSVAFNVEEWNGDEPPPLIEDFGEEFKAMGLRRSVDFDWKSFSDEGTKLGIAPLMLAAMNGHTNIVKLLIESNADVNQCIETNRNTALTLACFQGRTECVRELVEKGVNLEWRSKNRIAKFWTLALFMGPTGIGIFADYHSTSGSFCLSLDFFILLMIDFCCICHQHDGCS